MMEVSFSNPVADTSENGNGSACAKTDDARLRADTYTVIASLLSCIPSTAIIESLVRVDIATQSPPDTVGDAWQQLGRAARAITPDALDNEYHTLFIGLGRGQVVPYGSWYRTGFLMEKPLSELRDDLRRLGIEADAAEKDPEDHIAALCEVMAIILVADEVAEARQRAFFQAHIQPWAEQFFRDLQQAEAAVFYRSVGYLGEKFMQLEHQYLGMQAH